MLDIKTILASLGFVLAIISFISGLQVVRVGSFMSVEAKIHRVNGYITLVIYTLLASLSINTEVETRPWIMGIWLLGLLIILTKIWIVRSGRAYRFGGWAGTLLVIFWLAVIYIHAPV